MAKDEPSWLRVSCGGCSQEWFGYERPHCAVDGCHRTFDHFEDYEAHRVEDECINPVRLGLYRHERSGIWMRRVDVVRGSRRAS